MDIATLGLSVDSSGVNAGSAALERLSTAARKAEEAARRAGTAMADAGQRAVASATAGFSRLQAASERAASGIGKVFAVAARSVHLAIAAAVAAVTLSLVSFAGKIRPIEGEIASLKDYAGAAWDVISARAEKNLGKTLAQIAPWALEKIAATVQVVELVGTQINTTFMALPNVIAEATIGAVNSVISGVERMINAAVSGLNSVIDLANRIPGIDIGKFGNVDFGRVTNAYEGATHDLANQLQANKADIMGKDYFEEWSKAANARAWEASTKTKASRGGGADRASEYERATESVNKHIESLKIDAATYGMATREAERYRVGKELENAAIKSGLELTPALRVEILALSDAYGRYADAAANAAEAQQRLDTTRDEFRSSFSGFVSDVVKGESALNSLASALGRIGDKLLDMATSDLFDAVFGKTGSSSSFFGNLANGNSAGGLLGGTILPGILHQGGIAGNDNVPRRSVPAAAFLNAPRYHNGGIAGLRPDEVPAILQKGERIIPNGGSGAGQDITVHVSLDSDMLRAVVVDESGRQIAATSGALRSQMRSEAISAVRTAKDRRLG